MLCGLELKLVLTYLSKGIYMKNPYQQVGKRLRLIRKQKGFTQAELAEKAELSDNFIGLIERGEGHPTLPTLDKIAEALGVKLSDFFVSDDDEGKTSEQTLKEIGHLLKGREPKDAHLLLALGKKIFESIPAKK